MKIAFITDFFGKIEEMSFGPHPLINNIIRGVAQEEEVIVFSRGAPKKPFYEKIDGVDVYRSLSIPFEVNNSNNFFLGLKSKKIIEKEKVDLVNSQDISGANTFRLLGDSFNGKKISSIKGMYSSWAKMDFFKEKNKEKKSFKSRVSLENLLINHSDSFIVPSNFEKQEMELLSNDKKIKTIYNGIDTKLFCPKPELEEKNTILFAGGESIRKGSDLMIEAFASLKKDFPGLKLKILGINGLNRLNSKAVSLGINIDEDIEFLGRVSHNKLPEIINSSSIVVHPSYHETFGSIVVEAMACEKACVVSDSTALPEIVGNNAIMFDTGSVKSLVEKTKIILSDENKRKLIGKKARKHVEQNFKLERVIDDYLNYFRSLV